jgi:hypothetical protein
MTKKTPVRPLDSVSIIPLTAGQAAIRREAMQSVKLSKDARDLLRRRANGEQVAVVPGNLEVYRELTRVGLMEPFSGSTQGPEATFQFTEEGWRLANSLAAAEHLTNLSEPALRLLQSHLAAIGLRNGGISGTPTDETREMYRELARAGLMGACHSFSRGPESVYRITEEAYNRREELLAIQRCLYLPTLKKKRTSGHLSFGRATPPSSSASPPPASSRWTPPSSSEVSDQTTLPRNAHPKRNDGSPTTSCAKYQ